MFKLLVLLFLSEFYLLGQQTASNSASVSESDKRSAYLPIWV